MDSLIVQKIFTGEHKYTVGILFMFANLAGFFLNMRKLKVDDTSTIMVLIVFTIIARKIV